MKPVFAAVAIDHKLAVVATTANAIFAFIRPPRLEKKLEKPATSKKGDQGKVEVKEQGLENVDEARCSIQPSRRGSSATIKES